MEIQSLIRLAHQADLEGNYRVADKLTERAIREAQFFRNIGNIGRNVGEFLGNMATGRGARDTMNSSLNINPTAVGGGGGSVQQAVTSVADAASDFKMKTTNKGARTVYVTLPDGREVPTTGNMNRLLQPEVFNTLSPEDQALVMSRSRGMANLTKGTQTTQAGSAASGAASAAGGAANAGVSGINKADRFKSHNITGITGPAAVGLAGVVAALGGLGMYLMNGKVVDQRGNPVPPDRIPDDIKSRIPQFQMMTRREEAGQLGGAKALNAQNFVDSNASNPRLRNQRDWYNLALQTSGGDKNFANNVISYVKASPEMPSQVGGGPNI
jgi:hypothetical protein